MKRRNERILFAIILALLAPLALGGCGDDDDLYPEPPGPGAAQQVRDCYNLGKEPLYTTDSYGNVAEFLGCR